MLKKSFSFDFVQFTICAAVVAFFDLSLPLLLIADSGCRVLTSIGTSMKPLVHYIGYAYGLCVFMFMFILDGCIL